MAEKNLNTPDAHTDPLPAEQTAQPEQPQSEVAEPSVETSAPSEPVSGESAKSGKPSRQSARPSAKRTEAQRQSSDAAQSREESAHAQSAYSSAEPAVTVQNPGHRKEDEHLRRMAETVEDEKIRSYIIDRVMSQMKWYSAKSREYKKLYTWCEVIAIILGALIPIASVFANGTVFMKVLIALLGAGVTAVNAYSALNKYKDLWTSYRNTRESLLRLLYYYFNDMDTFAQAATQRDKDKLLIQLCETEMALENGSWRSLLANDESNKH